MEPAVVVHWIVLFVPRASRFHNKVPMMMMMTMIHFRFRPPISKRAPGRGFETKDHQEPAVLRELSLPFPLGLLTTTKCSLLDSCFCRGVVCGDENKFSLRLRQRCLVPLKRRHNTTKCSWNEWQASRTVTATTKTATDSSAAVSAMTTKKTRSTSHIFGGHL